MYYFIFVFNYTDSPNCKVFQVICPEKKKNIVKEYIKAKLLLRLKTENSFWGNQYFKPSFKNQKESS